MLATEAADAGDAEYRLFYTGRLGHFDASAISCGYCCFCVSYIVVSSPGRSSPCLVVGALLSGSAGQWVGAPQAIGAIADLVSLAQNTLNLPLREESLQPMGGRNTG
jgi:hypothetical protein